MRKKRGFTLVNSTPSLGEFAGSKSVVLLRNFLRSKIRLSSRTQTQYRFLSHYRDLSQFPKVQSPQFRIRRTSLTQYRFLSHYRDLSQFPKVQSSQFRIRRTSLTQYRFLSHYRDLSQFPKVQSPQFRIRRTSRTHYRFFSIPEGAKPAPWSILLLEGPPKTVPSNPVLFVLSRSPYIPLVSRLLISSLISCSYSILVGLGPFDLLPVGRECLGAHCKFSDALSSPNREKTKAQC
ncbi:hypothetical protein TNCV_1188841 [Trichonephila clavipes]|nr:hypothetical protein TNCV_1188841 [Trichonephila clavipes]